MITLLIPTDFNIQSLSSITYLLQLYDTKRVNLILVHFMKVTGSAQELLMLSKRSSDHQYISEQFQGTCLQLKDKYHDRIAGMRTEFFYGSTVVVFKNFLQVNNVDAVVMLNDYTYQPLTKNSLQPALLVNRLDVQVINVPRKYQYLPNRREAQSLTQA